MRTNECSFFSNPTCENTCEIGTRLVLQYYNLYQIRDIEKVDTRHGINIL